MDKERLEPNSPQEEAMWRAQVLRRTARICSAKAKELERMAKVDGNAPMRDGGTLKDVLKRIDNVMEWRFVNALGRGRPRRGHPRGEHRLRGPAHHALLRGGIPQANRGAGSGGGGR